MMFHLNFATRHYGNFTDINITVQVPSNIRVDSIPSTVTAGVNFKLLGKWKMVITLVET